MGTNGLSINEGVTDHDWEVVQVKKAMLKSADKTALLTIAEKLDTVQKMQVCNLQAIDYLLTELNPTDERLSQYSNFFTML
jgi:DeoR/GlpR family transcriptional regulator of sugar metabolism